MTKQVKFTETALRDGQQSQIATRMPIEDMLPVLEDLDSCGLYALEVWGGATFDSCLRYLGEDPWERLRTIRAHVKNAKLQMLLRGQNLLGYRNYADDVVEEFVRRSVENGIDVLRIFDALNDTRNLETSIRAAKEAGGEVQAAICYTTSDVHTVPYFVGLAREMAAAGADSICIKDMAGVLEPGVAHELVGEIKDAVDLPLEVHTHCTAGIAEMTLLRSIDAGADIIDTAISAFAGGTSQPCTESMAVAFEGMGYETGLNMGKLEGVAKHLQTVRERFKAEGGLNPKVMEVEPKALLYKVPGGMLSNLISNLADLGASDRYNEVLAEVPRVRADLGCPPLVTPLSQMVGSQALMNVLSGERYKVVPKEIKDYVHGKYGKSPAPIDPEVQQKIIGDDEPITCRPADLIDPQLPRIREEIAQYAKIEEDVLSYALFPDQARDFLGRREDPFYDVPVQEVEVSIDVA
ncbi:oxaloacetate decarboxylase subunit alpha [Enorma phocaeensis]|uniref:oxaloacetate decarboxylase subunit alpha n=1 Tax=Enorma phocaeensis TaxID=1871019 RepID=UPI00320B5100